VRLLCVNLAAISAQLFCIIDTMTVCQRRWTIWGIWKLPVALFQVKNSFQKVKANRLGDQNISIVRFTGCSKSFLGCWIIHVKKQNSFSVLSEHLRIVVHKFNRHKMNAAIKDFNSSAAIRSLHVVPIASGGLMH